MFVLCTVGMRKKSHRGEEDSDLSGGLALWALLAPARKSLALDRDRVLGPFSGDGTERSERERVRRVLSLRPGLDPAELVVEPALLLAMLGGEETERLTVWLDGPEVTETWVESWMKRLGPASRS